jgi:hypothetical protein
MTEGLGGPDLNKMMKDVEEQTMRIYGVQTCPALTF